MIQEPTVREDWNFRLVRYFLNNKQFTILLLAVTILGGVFAFSRFRVEGFPEIPVQVAVVSTIVPGAGPETIDSTVTVPLQAAIKDVRGVKEISSSSQASASVIFIQFDENTNATLAVQDVRTKLASVDLPDGAQEPTVTIPETGGAPFMIAATGPLSSLDLLRSSKPLMDELDRVTEVKSVEVVGGVAEKIYVDIAPEFQSANIGEQIKAGLASFPLGQVIVDGKQVPLSGERLINSVDDLKNLVVTIGQGVDAKQVKLADIASVYTALDYNNQINRVGYRADDGKKFVIQSAVLYEVRLEKTADLLRTENKVNDAIAAANTHAPESIDYVMMYNQAEDSRRQVDELVQGAVGGKWDVGGAFGNVGYIFGGIWLLVLVMLAFLDWRSALISVLAIPLSFLITFMVLAAFGIQLNTITLFSLIVVLGLIVDPAIVVLESIKRYMEVGLKGNTAVLKSIHTIGSGLFMAVLTSFIVFVPFALVSGTFGEIIKYIPFTVIPALIASYFVPMIFLTWLAGRFLKADKGHLAENEDDTKSLWRVAQWFVHANRYILKHTWLQIVVIILGLAVPIAIAGALFATGKVKQVQFAGASDTTFIQVRVPLDESLTYEQRLRENSKVETVMQRYVSSIRQYIYFDAETGGSGGTALSVFVQLVEPQDRTLSSKEVAEGMTADLHSLFNNEAVAKELGAGPPEASYPVSVKIFENDPAKIDMATQKIAEHLRGFSEVTGVVYDGEKRSKDIAIVPKGDALQAAGLQPTALLGQVAGVFSSRTVATLDGTDIVVRLPASRVPNTAEALKAWPIFSAQGPQPLESLAEVRETSVPTTIKRLNGDRYAEVSARVRDTRDIITVQRDITQWAKDNTSNLGVDSRAFEDRAGVNEFEKSFQELFLAIAASLVITYIAFVLFFKSFLQPLIILFAVPLMFIGIFPSLVAFAGGQFGFLEIIGIIMVIGIVENVGIFLIDYANRKVAEGMDKREAIAISSGIRFRAIVLTKLTALAGLLPLAVFAPFWRGLAVVVIMGIISSGILSLFTTPVLYAWFTRNKKPEVSTKPLF